MVGADEGEDDLAGESCGATLRKVKAEDTSKTPASTQTKAVSAPVHQINKQEEDGVVVVSPV